MNIINSSTFMKSGPRLRELAKVIKASPPIVY